MSDLPVIRTLSDLAALVAEDHGLHVRYSEGPQHDADQASIDTESGLRLPGLSVNPLGPESWWTRPLEDWLSRQLSQYRHLEEKNPARYAWVLRGREVGRGPDCEPLLTDITAVAELAPNLLDEAEARYAERFDAGKGPEDD